MGNGDNKIHLGIELGSTRIKAVLINDDFEVVSSGSHDWENKLENGYWTYSLDDVWKGIQDSYSNLKKDYKDKHNKVLTSVDSIGVSAMMHGYLPFDKEDNLLTPFRTWRNTTTDEAAYILTNEFLFNIPQRWSVAHLYQAILNKETHVSNISFLTTLAGYVHYKLTGVKVLGVGEASGMFPIDSTTSNYNSRMLRAFDYGIELYKFDWKIEDILPKVLNAGEYAGKLNEEGAKLLDPTQDLVSGIPLCPPEGDAGTGMVATNSISVNTGNISAGTSVFAMVVLEKELSKVHMELDLVTTPVGKPVAMVHCNNCTSDINAWVKMFNQVNELFGNKISTDELYTKLFTSALDMKDSTEGMVHYNYFSGESITNFEEGRPLLVRTPNSELNINSFMRSLLYSSIATLKIGMEILSDKEGVKLKKLLGHGGFFKTKAVGQTIMASALDTPIAVMETAGEGGPWGMAILASYAVNKNENETLDDYLNNKVFRNSKTDIVDPNSDIKEEFSKYMKDYINCLPVEKEAIERLKGE